MGLVKINKRLLCKFRTKWVAGDPEKYSQFHHLDQEYFGDKHIRLDVKNLIS